MQKRTVRFLAHTDLDGKIVNDELEKMLGITGLLVLYDTENDAHNRTDFYFYPYDPKSYDQVVITSKDGEFSESEDKIYIRSDQFYLFEVGDFLSPDEYERIERIAFAR